MQKNRNATGHALKKRRKARSARRRIMKIGIFIICLALSAYLGVRLAYFIDSPFMHAETGDEIDEVVRRGKNVVINTLIMGLDNDETRTDTILFVSYNSESGQCFMLSIPRDTYVHINGKKTLLNSAYALGGAELTIQKVKELTNLPVNYYVVFTFQDFRDVIDGLGGVEFDVRPQGYYYDDPYQNLHISIPGGRRVLDGKAAEGLVRYRNDYARADLERVEVQQKFVKALIEQKLSAKYVLALPGIYKDLRDSLKSNLSLSELTAYSKQVLSTGVSAIEAHTLPTFTSNDGAHLVPDEAGIRALINQYFEDYQQLDGENDEI